MILNMTGGGGNIESMINVNSSIQELLIEAGQTIEKGDFIQFNNGSWDWKFDGEGCTLIDDTDYSGYMIDAIALSNDRILYIAGCNSNPKAIIYSVGETTLTVVSSITLSTTTKVTWNPVLHRVKDNLFFVISQSYHTNKITGFLLEVNGDTITLIEEKVISDYSENGDTSKQSDMVIYDQTAVVCCRYNYKLNFVFIDLSQRTINIKSTSTYTDTKDSASVGVLEFGGIALIGRNKICFSYGVSAQMVLCCGYINNQTISFGEATTYSLAVSDFVLTRPIIINNYSAIVFCGSDSANGKGYVYFNIDDLKSPITVKQSITDWSMDVTYDIVAEKLYGNNIITFCPYTSKSHRATELTFGSNEVTTGGLNYQGSICIKPVQMPNGSVVLLSGSTYNDKVKLYMAMRSQPTISKATGEIRSGIALESGNGENSIKILIFDY